MTTIATAPRRRRRTAGALPVGSAVRRGHRQLTCRVVATLAAAAAAAVFAFVAGQPLTARPARVFAELLADSIAAGHGTADNEPTQLHTAATMWAGAADLRLARMRRVATPPTRRRPAVPAGRRGRRMLEELPRDGETSTVAVRRQPGRWLHRIGIGVALLAGLLLVPAVAHAEPTPAPPSPSAPAQPPAPACGGGDLPADQQRWCFGWAVYTAKPARNSVSHWTTACTRTKTPDELAACQTVSLEFTSKPKDGARATLADVPAGTAPVKDMVGCKQFVAAAREAAGKGQQGFSESQIWLGMASRCDAIAEALLPALGAAVAPPPPKVDKKCDTLDQQCKIDKAVGGAVERGIDAGIQGVINLIVQGVAVVLSWLASQVFTQTSIGAPDDAFYLVYNSTAGIMLIFVFVLFIISAIINTLRFGGGPSPLASVGGLVRAVIGITFAGGLAWLIVTAWDQATNALLAQNDSTAWDASIWITALTNLSGGAGTGAIALIAGLFSLIGLLFLFVIMLFRGMLTTAAALFGAVAMAGQASHETRSWGRRWFWTVNALAMSKFAIAALWIYGTRAAYGSNDITTVLQAVLIIWLMVLAPGILLRLTAIWDGYLADANGRGFATAAAAGIGDLAGRAADSLMDRVGGGGGGGGGGDAAEVMDDNVTDMDNAGSGNGTDDPESTDGGAVEGLAETAGELTEDAETNESGEQVGAADSNGGPAAAGDDGGGSPNGDEADAIDDNATGAQTDVAAATHDLSAGRSGDQDDNGSGMQVPMDPTGESGTEQPGVDDTGNGAADPAATSSGAGSAEPDGTSSDPAGADGSTSLPGLGDGSESAGADVADPSGGSPPTQPAAPAGTDGGGSDGSDGASEAGAEPPGGGAPAAGEGAAGAGGAAGGSSAAAAAAV